MSIHNKNMQLLFLTPFRCKKTFSKFDKLLAAMVTKVHPYGGSFWTTFLLVAQLKKQWQSKKKILYQCIKIFWAVAIKF